ncbi:testis-specific gene A8 protein [Scomber scombrus]|uniref:testis-specific gene A8 protein n=1 Tax=Scomber scombrus TaxID=13677 RepID=UPI002DD99E6D|nr:testis-specific gene A8 protein [Scomber scombrus]
MNVQLLLLLALAGPFCTFTHASPTALPLTDIPGTESAPDHGMTTDSAVHFSTELSAADDSTVFTGPPATDPPAAPADVTKALTENVPETTAPTLPETTEEPVVETVAPAAASTEPPAAPESIITDAPSVETAAPTEPAKPEVPPAATGAAEEGPGGEVVVEEGEEYVGWRFG